MSISILYNKAHSNPLLYNQLLGISKQTFDELLNSFRLDIPKRLSNAQRLFAVLYAEYKELGARDLGELLGYVNSKRDGAYFLSQAKNALNYQRRKMKDLVFGDQALKPLEHTAPILISYRNDNGKRMHGAFYDHYTMRCITARETYISKSPEHQIKTFSHFIEFQTVLALGINNQVGARVIPEIKEIKDHSSGLLVIPGHPSKDHDDMRKMYEQNLIDNARNTGQPVLAICAGSWRLWEGFGGATKDVTGHSYSNMPYILDSGGVGNNKQIHRIKLNPNTIVTGAMYLDQRVNDDNPTVNSVHWKAVDMNTLPEMLEPSATAVEDEALNPVNRQGKMVPEPSIEAFETKHGAPMVGIQWHPEAYYKNSNKNGSERHLNLIQYMAKAGDAYQARRQMVDELGKVAQLLKKQGLFKKAETNGTLKPGLVKQLMQNN